MYKSGFIYCFDLIKLFRYVIINNYGFIIVLLVQLLQATYHVYTEWLSMQFLNQRGMPTWIYIKYDTKSTRT